MPPKPYPSQSQQKGGLHPERSILQKKSKITKKSVEFDRTVKHNDSADGPRNARSTKSKVRSEEEEEVDLSGKHGKEIFVDNLRKSLYPLSTLLSAFGRFPLARKQSKDNKTLEYIAACSTMSMFHFNITTIVLYYALLTGLYNVVQLELDFPISSKSITGPRKTQLEYDKALVQRNCVPLIIVFAALIQACLSSAFFTRKYHYLAHIFTFIEKATYTLHMDMADKTRNFSIQSTVRLTIITCVFIMFASLKFGPSTVGATTTFGSLMVRVFLGFGHGVWLDPDNRRRIHAVQILGGIFLVVIFTASVAPILLFIYKCKIVKNAFAFWNGRAYCTLLRGMEFAQTEESRTTYNLLWKDHCVLLDLVESLDKMYSLTLESFCALETFSLFFQMYFFHRTASKNGTQLLYASTMNMNISMHRHRRSFIYVRPFDWLPALAILVTTSVLLFLAGKAAADVGEEAAAGMEVIRRKGMIGRRTDQELEFLYSLNYSFQHYNRIEVFGAGYMYMNKALIVRLFVVALFCFFLLCQFHPLLDYRPRKSKQGASVARFLRLIEGTADHSKQWGNPSDDREWAVRH